MPDITNELWHAMQQRPSNALLCHAKKMRTGKVRRLRRKLHLLYLAWYVFKIRFIYFLGLLQTSFENITGIAKIKERKFLESIKIFEK